MSPARVPFTVWMLEQISVSDFSSAEDKRLAEIALKALDRVLVREVTAKFEAWPRTHHEHDGAFKCSCGRTWGAIANPTGMCAGCLAEATPVWACGWSASGRCLRAGCHKSSRCSGFTPQVPR